MSDEEKRAVKALLLGVALVFLHVVFACVGVFGTVVFAFTAPSLDGAAKIAIIGVFSLIYPGILFCLALHRPGYVLSVFLSLLAASSLVSFFGVSTAITDAVAGPMPVFWMLENAVSSAVPFLIYTALAAVSWKMMRLRRRAAEPEV